MWCEDSDTEKRCEMQRFSLGVNRMDRNRNVNISEGMLRSSGLDTNSERIG